VKKFIFGFIIFTFFAPLGVWAAVGEGDSEESGAHFDTHIEDAREAAEDLARDFCSATKIHVPYAPDDSDLDLSGNVPLHRCADSGHLETMKYQLKNGCPINVCNNAGDTPLHCAVRGRQETVLLFLLLAEDVSGKKAECLKNNDGQTPLDYARMSGHKVCEFLLRKFFEEGIDIGSISADEVEQVRADPGDGIVAIPLPPLYREQMHNLAKLPGSQSGMKRCLDKGWDINARNSAGDTPLHCAARRGHVETLLFLLRTEDNFGNRAENLENNDAPTILKIVFHT